VSRVVKTDQKQNDMHHMVWWTR